MKQRFQVEVRETYSKFVEVYAEDETMIDEEVSAMQECGEIEWDYTEDFDSWDIIGYEKSGYKESEIAAVKKWCAEMVAVTSIVDPDWVEEEMNENQCMDWLEQIRDRGVSIPVEVTSSDLWDAVLKSRERSAR